MPKAVSDLSVVICTVLSATVCALLFPVKEDKRKEDDKQ
jgi:hypothetical protein